MQKSNAEILNHFYGLLIEMNFVRPEEDVYPEKNYVNDPFIQKHMRQIKLQTAKYRALRSKNNYTAIVAEIKRLKEIGFDEIKKILTPKESLRLQPLFSKFEELSKKDEDSIAEDEEMLQLINALKDKLDKQSGDE